MTIKNTKLNKLFFSHWYKSKIFDGKDTTRPPQSLEMSLSSKIFPRPQSMLFLGLQQLLVQSLHILARGPPEGAASPLKPVGQVVHQRVDLSVRKVNLCIGV